jgi:peptidoglycan/LPS O-acetylase OafA/YrhL
MIANGGLIGDVIFFAVSGYCLYNVKGNFIKWYGKRLIRCYLPVWVITAVYMLLGAYSLESNNAFWWYLYPTAFHFVSSIVALYIPFFIIMKCGALRKRIPWIMLGIAVVYLAVYLFAYDKSYYHIDTVREPMILFLFMESMLLGAWFRQSDEKLRNRFSWWQIGGVAVFFAAYFASKILFSGCASLSQLQVINQALIFALLYCILRLFAGLDSKLEKLPGPVGCCIRFLAEITLEIYVVQSVLINWIRPLLGFPVNWLALTASIVLAAAVLHYVCEWIRKLGERIIRSVKGARV